MEEQIINVELSSTTVALVGIVNSTTMQEGKKNCISVDTKA